MPGPEQLHLHRLSLQFHALFKDFPTHFVCRARHHSRPLIRWNGKRTTAPQMWVISLRNRFRNGKMPGPAVTTHPSKNMIHFFFDRGDVCSRWGPAAACHTAEYAGGAGHYAVCFFFMRWLKQNKCSKQKLQMSCTNKLVRINQALTSVKKLSDEAEF